MGAGQGTGDGTPGRWCGTSVSAGAQDPAPALWRPWWGGPGGGDPPNHLEFVLLSLLLRLHVTRSPSAPEHPMQAVTWGRGWSLEWATLGDPIDSLSSLGATGAPPGLAHVSLTPPLVSAAARA